MIVFGPNYLVGCAQIDEQHKELFSIFNQLLTYFQTPQGEVVLHQTFKNLLEYTRYHFSTEEQLMVIHGYPDFEAHKKEHEAIRKKVLKFDQYRSNDDLKLFDEAVQFLINWLSHHIFQVDKRLGKFLEGKPLSPLPSTKEPPAAASRRTN